MGAGRLRRRAGAGRGLPQRRQQGRGFAVVLRIFFEGLPDESISSDWADIFAVVAAVSMTVGNVFALVQTNIKRLLGYSSIAQAGNFMVGLAAISAGAAASACGASGVLFFVGDLRR